MKERCAGLVVVLVSLVAFGVGNAQTPFHGVIDPNTHTVTVDTAIVTLHSVTDTIPTPGWTAAGAGVDTFDFGNLDGWPLAVTLLGTIDGSPNTSYFSSPAPDTWYRFAYGGITAPRAMFFTLDGAEESRSAIEPRPCLNVSPSVVTAQMMVRVQPARPDRPVVAVLDAAGNLVRSLNCTAGANGLATAMWHREDGLGHLVPDGVYFCRYAASGAIAVRKILVAH